MAYNIRNGQISSFHLIQIKLQLYIFMFVKVMPETLLVPFFRTQCISTHINK